MVWLLQCSINRSDSPSFGTSEPTLQSQVGNFLIICSQFALNPSIPSPCTSDARLVSRVATRHGPILGPHLAMTSWSSHTGLPLPTRREYARTRTRIIRRSLVTLEVSMHPFSTHLFILCSPIIPMCLRVDGGTLRPLLFDCRTKLDSSIGNAGRTSYAIDDALDQGRFKLAKHTIFGNVWV